MGSKFCGVWAASVLTIATLAARQSDDAEGRNAARLKAAMEELNKAAAHQNMPDDLRRPAQYYLQWLGPRLLSKDQKWNVVSGVAPAPAESKPEQPKPAEPTPAAYAESLELDLKALQAALKNKDRQQREEAASRVVEDLKVKSDDCQKFGRGRLVQVEVFTTRGGQVVNNWQVYYKYAAVGDMPTAKLPMESLSSPARKLLPPGQYDFQAEAVVDGSFVESAVVRCAVGGTPMVRLQIQILH